MRRPPDPAPPPREHRTPFRPGRHPLGGRGRDEPVPMLPARTAAFREKERDPSPLFDAHAEAIPARRLRIGDAALECLFDPAPSGERLADAGQALVDQVRFKQRALFPPIEAFFEEAVP